MFDGNRPSNILPLARLTPTEPGKLVALYEQSTPSINGAVELGKILA